MCGYIISALYTSCESELYFYQAIACLQAYLAKVWKHHTCMYTYMCVCTHAHVCMYTCMYTHAFCECPRHAYHNTTFMCAVSDLLPSGFQFLDVMYVLLDMIESLALRLLSSLIISHASKISAHYCF